MYFGRQKGFTLIELVLVISITGILAFSAVALFNVDEIPFSSAVEKLKHDIRHAQWEAMNRKIRHGVVFNTGIEEYSVYRVTATNIIPDPLNPSKTFTVNYLTDDKFKGVEIISVDINGTSQIEFDGRGIPYDGGGNPLNNQGIITLSHNGATGTITIEPDTGRVGN